MEYERLGNAELLEKWKASRNQEAKTELERRGNLVDDQGNLIKMRNFKRREAGESVYYRMAVINGRPDWDNARQITKRQALGDEPVADLPATETVAETPVEAQQEA